ncbi:riboflavin aldehyde-forming enzyme [Trichosporon asahii var. asahii CBS 2479]|uniref:Riboflavin aldehyde-forming enzyme n=1 Tax=Trichosporon asahii var. asahii (strain ATCC 90039 / CBS 2479 / JCM 2466 / KCTC 7840 / NBRC 103889/ NCYC 2677 / UAMH 7654) TaxID=1186058 RepID=J6FD33_TRIAS|nr:riboflavin aldehyde-forming enzyme [Trichosporon asahii var. asahii CBS 2479]EJT52957.1 riboflavin aldehyde-forming enzyme [Trichosporon asahii var. asahii CBS 2479]
MKTTVIATLALALSAAAAPLASSQRHVMPHAVRTHRNLARRGQKCENGTVGHNFAAEAPVDVAEVLDTGAKKNKKQKGEHKQDNWTSPSPSSSSSTAESQPTENGDKHDNNQGNQDQNNQGNNDNKDQGQSGSVGSGWASGDYAWGSGPDFLKIGNDGKYVGSGPRANAKGTFYSLQNPAENHGYDKTACGTDNPSDTTPLVAMSKDNWNELWQGSSYDAPICGRHIRVTYKGRSAIATVNDQCATCKYNHIDMSPVLFYYLTDGKEAGDALGEMKGPEFSWEWVDDAPQAPGSFTDLPSDGFHWDGSGGAGTNPW